MGEEISIRIEKLKNKTFVFNKILESEINIIFERHRLKERYFTNTKREVIFINKIIAIFNMYFGPKDWTEKIIFFDYEEIEKMFNNFLEQTKVVIK